MKVKRIETPKVVKISVANHAKAANLVRNMADTFNTIFGRALNVYEALPEIREKINDLYRQLSNHYGGNTEEKERIEKERVEFMEFLRALEQ